MDFRRQVAHLGVLKAFEEQGLKPSFHFGMISAGPAAVIYAFGMTLDEIHDLTYNLHSLSFSKLNVPRL